MRSPLDRLRHGISFELIALCLVVPLGATVFNLPMHNMGVLSIVGASVATVWNIVYNIGFDRALQSLTGSTQKSWKTRIIHALSFEIGLLAIFLPFIAWYLGIGLWEAFVMDLSFAMFYVVYAFIFNWAYDRIFPLPEWQ